MAYAEDPFKKNVVEFSATSNEELVMAAVTQRPVI